MLGSLLFNIFRKVLKNGRNSPCQSSWQNYCGWPKENWIIRSRKRILWYGVNKWQNHRQNSMSINSNCCKTPAGLCILTSSQILTFRKEVWVPMGSSKNDLVLSTRQKGKQQTRNCQKRDRRKDRSHHYTILKCSGWGYLDHFMQFWSIHLTKDRHYD